MDNRKRIDVRDLPEPEMLALKTSNRTIPVSLRVKEDSYGFFVKTAEKYGSTPSALINELINSYVSQHDETNEQNPKLIISRGKITELCMYMRNQLDAFSSMPDDVLLIQLYRYTRSDDKSTENAVIFAKDLISQIEDIESKHDSSGIVIKNCPVEYESGWHAHVYGSSIMVPGSIWPLIATYVMAFITKRNELFGTEGFKVSQSFLSSLEMNINKANSRHGLINRLKTKFNTAAGITPADLLAE